MLTVTAVALAQQDDLKINYQASAKPAKGGSKKKPKATTLSTAFTVNPESRRTVSRITYYIPKGVKVSGAGFPSCTADFIGANGDGACPKGSQVGSGTSQAVLNGQNSATLNFIVKVFAAGKSGIALSLSGAVPTVFPGKISKARGKFSQKIVVNIPTSVQSPVPGAFAYILNVKNTLGGKVRKGKKKYSFASLVGCPKNGKSVAGVSLDYVQNDVGPAGKSKIATSTTKCK